MGPRRTNGLHHPRENDAAFRDDCRQHYVFFFSSRRRHTRCLSDWSSDVCSSDLASSCAIRTWTCSGNRERQTPLGQAAREAPPGSSHPAWYANLGMSPHDEANNRFYAVVRLIARFWIWFLFREVAVRAAGRVPPSGPVLLCVNHPNNLIDSLLLGVVLPRKVHYLANASLFGNPILARLLSRAGAIPVHRRQDDPDGAAHRNAGMFTESREALRAGHVLAIYPEGTTHAEARVQRIKTGAARIALDYETTRATAGSDAFLPLALLPVGLSFEARKSFRGRVLVAFGEPLPLGPHVERARANLVAAVEGLTDVIQSGMEAEIVNVDRMDTADVLRAVEELYRAELVRQLRAEQNLPPEAIDVFRLSRTIVEAVAHFR